MERGSGVLLHISSLPSDYGIGTFGKEAFKFIRILKKKKQKYWQFLPLSPTGYKDSPYQSFSTFALNPYFIDLDILIQEQLLKKEEVESLKWFIKENQVDYGLVYQNKEKILEIAYQRGYAKEKKQIQIFYQKNKHWLDDYALYMALKKYFHHQSWNCWEEDYKNRKKSVIHSFKEEYHDWIEFYIYIQYLAFKQYKKLKAYAKANGILLIGDCPIYVNFDSSDVWANQNQFLIDSNHQPRLVAGVPPDYFSKTGQLWGNPIYDYHKMKKNQYAWWVERLRHYIDLYDYIRIDHFRGFEAYYAIPHGEETALNGKWYKGPANDFFDTIKQKLNYLPFIVEDLGMITEEVKKLKDDYHFPGLKIVLFAFDKLDYHHPYLPTNYEKNCVAYLGTHDNQTFYGYMEEQSAGYKNMKNYYKAINQDDLYQKVLKDLYESSAQLVIIQMQDIIKQGKESRMNIPGSDQNNWTYRLQKSQLKEEMFDFIYSLTMNTDRA